MNERTSRLDTTDDLKQLIRLNLRNRTTTSQGKMSLLSRRITLELWLTARPGENFAIHSSATALKLLAEATLVRARSAS